MYFFFPGISSIFFIGRVRVIYLDIMSAATLSIIQILCLASRGCFFPPVFCRGSDDQVSRYFVGRLTVNNLRIFLGVSVKFLCIASGVLCPTTSIFCRASGVNNLDTL